MTSRPWKPGVAIWVSVGLHVFAIGAIAARPQLWPWALALIAVNHMVLTGIGLWPRSTLLGPNMLRLPASRAKDSVGLSFDDGPHPVLTPWVLDQLDAYQAKASFFCVGERIKQYPDLVREIHARGHRVENHSATHSKAFSTFGMGALGREMDETTSQIQALTGRAPTLFRAPAGLRSPLLEPVLAKRGLLLASWTRRGFDTVERNAQKVIDRLTERLTEGDILLLHDGNCADDADGVPVIQKALPALLEATRAKGLRGVALAD